MTSVLHKYRNAVGVLIVLHHSHGSSLSTLLNVIEHKQVKKHSQKHAHQKINLRQQMSCNDKYRIVFAN